MILHVCTLVMPHGGAGGGELIAIVDAILNSMFSNGWLERNDGSIGDYGRYQVQMNGKGSIVKMLQRRLDIPKERTISIGDSAGDIGMFQQSELSICFNPWDEKPVAVAKMTIRSRNLLDVLDSIRNFVIDD